MPEVISWREGSIYLWTGTATASALLGYAKDMSVNQVVGYDNYQTFDTAYHDNDTGQRADANVGALYTTDSLTLQKFFDAKTGVHVHFKHTGVYGSAGIFLYSGRIDSLVLAGTEKTMTQWRFQYHANRWSSY